MRLERTNGSAAGVRFYEWLASIHSCFFNLGDAFVKGPAALQKHYMETFDKSLKALMECRNIYGKGYSHV